jgi:putative SOS response-associated peptidase YedK
MCGRFNLRANSRQLAEIFQLLREPDLTPRYNIAPTQPVAVIRQVDTDRELSMIRWGLVPSWSKDPKSGPPLINARADTVATKPAFRTAFKRRRCLIPADGFWRHERVDSFADHGIRRQRVLNQRALRPSTEGLSVSGSRANLWSPIDPVTMTLS